MAERAASLTVAVTGALDLALNQGKGKVLERWLEDVLRERKPKRPRMTDRAFAFFGSLPKKRPGRENR